ncbi:MAG: hypothetical protein HY812_10540 [Planctomycetes bacterium]|nr:hypothetical protein [Planctomycetota bacterium]
MNLNQAQPAGRNMSSTAPRATLRSAIAVRIWLMSMSPKSRNRAPVNVS